jgi:phage I-like protein
VQLIPAGTFQFNDGRGQYHNTAPDQVIANTRSYLDGREANADYDHATEYVAKTGQPAIAAGWIKDWRVADGAVEARVEWTALAAQRIRDGEYRYVSPVFDAAKGDGQVVRLRRFALTNNPAINALPAIAASQEESEVELKKLIASVLGLVEDASTETITATLRDKLDPAKWISAEQHQKLSADLQAVAASRDELQKKLVDIDIDTVISTAMREGRLLPYQRPYWESLCASAHSADPAREYFKTAAVIVKPGEETVFASRHIPETKITAATLTDEQREEARRYGVRDESYAKALNEAAVGASDFH